MSVKHEVDELIKAALFGTMPVLTLRGTDSLLRPGGDLDYMVPNGMAVAACGLLAELATAKGWFVVGFRNITYLAQIVLLRPRSAGEDEAVKIDFFDGLRWYGVGHDAAGVALFNRLLPGADDAIRLASAASFLQKILIVGRQTHDDWARVVASGGDVDYVSEVAGSLGLPVSQAQVRARGVVGLEKWRLRAASGGVTGWLSALIWLAQTVIAHATFKSGVGTGAGLVLGVSGMDGSGKSTLVNRLAAGLWQAGGERPQIMHLLPSWIPLPHQLFRRAKTQKNYTRPYTESPVSSRTSGRMRLAFYLVAFAVARLFVWCAAARGRLVIMDRSCLDFFSDLTRARIPSFRVPPWVLQALTPAGRFFYLDASPANVVARKGELSLEKASSLRASYLRASHTAGVTILNGDDPPDKVFEELLAHLSKEYIERINRICLGD